MAGAVRARLGTVRVRTTVAAVAVVGLAMALGALVLVAVLRDTLTREVRAAARLRGQDVGAVLASGPGRSPPGCRRRRRAADPGAGRGRAGGRGQPQRRRPAAGGPARGPASRPRSSSRPGGPSRRAASSWPWPPAPTPRWGGARWSSPGPPRSSPRRRGGQRAARRRAAAAAGGGGGDDLDVVGRALAPVEAIRAEVDAISAAALHRRVPDPPADDEIGRLARTMNRMLGRLEQAQARQRRLVSDASHELRSPVAVHPPARRGRPGPPRPDHHHRAGRRPCWPRTSGSSAWPRTCCC